MNRTKIDWADYSWNPVWGCRGTCVYCYARRTAKRYGLRVVGRDDFVPTFIERNFLRAMPKEPSRIFVNSMSDVADWKPDWFLSVADRVWENPQHRFLFLSKRPWEVSWNIAGNARLGFSATCDDDLWRCAEESRKRETGGLMGNVSFLSVEPMHGPITLNMEWLPSWIIVGAETGNRKGKVTPEPGWIEDIYEYATKNGIPLFFKESLRSLWPFDGYDYFPQEFPA